MPFKTMQNLGWKYAGEYDCMMPPKWANEAPPFDPGMFGFWFKDTDGRFMFQPYTLPGSPYANKSLWYWEGTDAK